MKKNLPDIIAAMFIMLFVYAACSKLMDFQKFEVQLGKSPLLSPFVGLVSWLVPLIEIFIAVTLMIKRWQLIGLYLSFMLMVMFSCYIVIVLNFSAYVPCSCGGILENMSWKQHLVFNSGFVVLGVVGVLIFPGQRTIAIEG